MADLVRNHIGLGKFARRVQARGQGLEEVQIQIHFFIAWAIKRPHGCLPCAAGGGGAAGVEHQGRVLVAQTLRGKNFAPNIFGIGHHGAHKSRLRVGAGTLRTAALALPAVGQLPLHAADQIDGLHGVDAQKVRHRQADDDAAYAQFADSAACTAATAVFDIVGLALALPFHLVARFLGVGRGWRAIIRAEPRLVSGQRNARTPAKAQKA